MPHIQSTQKYTYQDYLTWDDNERWELIDGVPYNMTPRPNRKHEDIAGKLFNRLYNALENSDCSVYKEGPDLVLSNTVVLQPDVFVVCEPEKFKKNNIQGAPTFVIEILSPSTSRKDRMIKREIYEQFGVKEYWIVDPEDESVECYLLQDNGTFGKSTLYKDQNEIELISLPGITLSVQEIFDTPYKDQED